MRRMKKIFIFLVLVFGLVSVFACSKSALEEKKKKEADAYKETTQGNIFDFDKNYNGKKIAVVYFSATGNTKTVADKIAEIFSCETLAIEPELAYTETDLTSYDPSTRPMRERAYDPFNPPEESEEDEIQNGTRAQDVERYKNEKSIDVKETDTENLNDNNVNTENIKEGSSEKVVIEQIKSLPKIKKINVDGYDTIFLGYPIWFGEAPRVMYEFISTVNLKNKLIIPFCTSDNNDISPSDQNLANFAPDDVYFMSGKRFTKESSIEDIKKWATSISADLDVR